MRIPVLTNDTPLAWEDRIAPQGTMIALGGGYIFDKNPLFFKIPDHRIDILDALNPARSHVLGVLSVITSSLSLDVAYTRWHHQPCIDIKTPRTHAHRTRHQ